MPARLAELDLDRCAQEPIRVPGGIQPHGALLVLHSASLQVLQASTNASDLLGAPAPLLGLPLASITHETFERQVRHWLASSDGSFLRAVTLAHRGVQVSGHRTSQGVVLEFEALPVSESESLGGLYPRIGRFLEDMQGLQTLEALCHAAACEFRRVSGFNRVLIYRFDREWHGEVLAEDNDGVLPSYLGLRFPASDIPAQARELYRVNRLRLIPDANYTPVAIEPRLSPLDNAPLDLSFAALRSVSPVHLQYMRNMGTLASMSISILVDGALWGLVSCHNATPKRVNAQQRTACDLLGQVLSQQIGAQDRLAYAAGRIELKKVEGELLAHLAGSDTLEQGLVEHPELWLRLTGSTAGAVVSDDAVLTVGPAPPTQRIQQIVARLRERDAADMFVCDSLAEQWSEFSDIAGEASGLLAISISQLHPSYVLWFRPEVVRTVRWAGDPSKPGQGEHLTPRRSFATWKEQVCGRALPWCKAELDSAADFRTAVINVVLRRAEERAELTGQLQRSNRELESFAYSVSHDLRAPFRHIVGYTQLLSEQEAQLSDKARHYLASINDAAMTAGRLVDDLLNFSQLGRTALTMSNVDMEKLLREVLRSLEPDTRDRRIEWHLEALPAAWGDGALLRQALINLIDNALKYTRGREPAVIRVRGEQTCRECIYTVTDNGVGFDMAYAHKLFGVFQRLHRMEDFEGTGIGLALVKRIVERHGGWIGARGSLGQGATFEFGIPLQASHEGGGERGTWPI